MMKGHQLFKHSSEDMKELASDSIHLVVTSPPYNEMKKYSEDLPFSDSLDWIDYIELLKTVFAECFRVLVPGGRICVNIANLGRFKIIKTNGSIKYDYYKRLDSLVASILLELGFIDHGTIIWFKGEGANVTTAWGSFQSASDPTLRDTHEYVIIFSKPDSEGNKTSLKLYDASGKLNIDKKEFLDLTKSVWTINPVSNNNHPCVYPLELASRLIKLYSFENQTVLDCFAGSGTTAKAAFNLKRKSISFEVETKFYKLIEEIINQTSLQQWFSELENPQLLKEGI